MRGIGELGEYLESNGDFVVEALAKELRPEWVSEALKHGSGKLRRVRRLPARVMVWIVILMCLYRRISYVNLLEKLIGTWWMKKHWDKKRPPSSPALTKARDRVGIEPFRNLFERSSQEWIKGTEGLRIHGKRVLGLDGTTVKTPDTKKNRRFFGKPGASRGRSAYPQMRVVTLSDVGTRLIRDARHGPYRKAEIDLARELLGVIEPDSIVTMDRNFLAYDFLWDIKHDRKADFVVRLKNNIHPRSVKRLGKGDVLVEVEIPRYYRRKRKDMPRFWQLRMITYIPEGGREAIRLLTSLTDTEFTKEELAELYHERWEEETITDEIKTHLCDCATVNRPVAFRSKKPQRVEQEWYGMLIAYNVLRKIMTHAAKQSGVCPRRISFISALERLREAAWDMSRIPTQRLPSRYAEMLTAMTRTLVPIRKIRHNPRAVKIKMSGYPLKRSRKRKA